MSVVSAELLLDSELSVNLSLSVLVPGQRREKLNFSRCI